MLPVPPTRYAGTERVIAVLVDELQRLGHKVTLFASGDSNVSCELVPTVPRSLWSTGYREDLSSWMSITLAEVWRQHSRFDVIHSHLETHGFLFARLCPTPVVTTLHGRLDVAGAAELIDEFIDIPLVAISASQRRWHPDANWVATIHHGLSLEQAPFEADPGDYLAFVGRVAEEKGVTDAINLARMTGLQLRMAAKAYDRDERDLLERVVEPAVAEGVVEFLGEVDARERDPLLAGALATLMIGAWPEPFGLVAIESLATGTPVIARRVGALPEIVEHGVDGYLVDDLTEAKLAVGRVGRLDRRRIRERALTRFAPDRMARDYESAYRKVIAEWRPAAGRLPEVAAPAGRAAVPDRESIRSDLAAQVDAAAPVVAAVAESTSRS